MYACMYIYIILSAIIEYDHPDHTIVPLSNKRAIYLSRTYKCERIYIHICVHSRRRSDFKFLDLQIVRFYRKLF